MGISRIYLDSYYLLEVIMKTDLKTDVERLWYRISGGSFKIILLQTVLGETAAKISQMYNKQELPDRFVTFANIISEYKIDVDHCLPPPQGHVFAMMDELQHKDQYLNNTDIMILAQVLYDPYSKFFITPDSKLVDNPAIKSYERELRESGRRHEKLKITEII